MDKKDAASHTSPEGAPSEINMNANSPLFIPRLLRITVLLLIWGAPGAGAASGIFIDAAQSKLRQGVSEYAKEDFDRAEQKFREAQGERPSDPHIAYNLGNSYYRQGKFKEALQEYVQAATGDSNRDLKQKSVYNTGNVLFRLGKLEESATAYKKALELDPSDMDAKFNLEFVREQMQKKEESGDSKQPDDSSGKGDNSDDRSDNKDPDADSNPGDQPKDNNAPPDAKAPPEQNQNPTPPEQAQRPPEPPADASPAQGARQSGQSESNGELTEQQAEQWLGSLDEDLKRFQKRKSEQRAGGVAQPEKDWRPDARAAHDNNDANVLPDGVCRLADFAVGRRHGQ